MGDAGHASVSSPIPLRSLTCGSMSRGIAANNSSTISAVCSWGGLNRRTARSEPSGDPGATPASPSQAPRDYQAANLQRAFRVCPPLYLIIVTLQGQTYHGRRCTRPNLTTGLQRDGRSVVMNGLPQGMIRGPSSGTPRWCPNSHI